MKEKIISFNKKFICVYGITDERLNKVISNKQDEFYDIIKEINKYYVPYVYDNNGNKKYLLINENNEITFIEKPYYFIDELITNSDQSEFLMSLYDNYFKINNNRLYSEIFYEIYDYKTIQKIYLDINY